MLKVGLVGIGSMGRGHLDQYIRLESENAPVKLVAICDIDDKKFQSKFRPGGNLGDLGQKKYDFTKYHCYTDFDEMIANEELDYVDMALPTFLHSYYAIKALDAKLNVLSEKPMASTPTQCQMMIDAAKRNGKKLMVAQCLRFWPAYETLKHYVDTGEMGKPVFAYFFRGGSTPQWSYQGWLRDENRSGGCLLDQHIHDVDMVNWLFGIPKAVSTMGKNVIPGCGFDALSTHYRYDGFVVNAQDDWSMNGNGVNFQMLYRVNFERGSVSFENGVTRVCPIDGETFIAHDKGGDDGYYFEIKYFYNAIINDTQIETAAPESTRNTICIAVAERESALNDGEWTTIRL